MRVALVGTGVQPIPPTGYGGVERTLAEFSTALRAAGHEPVVINEVRAGRTIDEYRFALRLPSLLRHVDFDVLHASTPVVAARLSLGRLAFVYTTHSRHWFERRGARQRWGFWLEQRAVRRARATVALTPRLADTIRRLTPPRGPPRMEVIPIGVDTARFRPAWDRRTGGRALGVGIVAPFKRWELAARALRGTGLRLSIAGPTPDPAYAATVRGSGESVELLGEIDDAALTAQLAESDLLIHPSRVELLPGAVLQGLAAGLPVIGAEPLAGIVDDDRTGYLAPAGADDGTVERSLRKSAQRLVADPALRRKMGETGRLDALTRFSWPTVVDQHLTLYRSVFGAS